MYLLVIDDTSGSHEYRLFTTKQAARVGGQEEGLRHLKIIGTRDELVKRIVEVAGKDEQSFSAAQELLGEFDLYLYIDEVEVEG